jgi:NAD(P)H-hydrate repair Nnr-like enzyme with NAD(P)H-hydrate dehydratase domain
LAGFMAGLLAQPDLQKEPTMAMRYAVWAHGTAADRLTQTRRNWTVEDLAAALGS